MKRFLLFIAIMISSVGLFAQNVGDNTIIDYEGYSLKFTVTSVEPAECEHRQGKDSICLVHRVVPGTPGRARSLVGLQLTFSN